MTSLAVLGSCLVNGLGGLMGDGTPGGSRFVAKEALMVHHVTTPAFHGTPHHSPQIQHQNDSAAQGSALVSSAHPCDISG